MQPGVQITLLSLALLAGTLAAAWVPIVLRPKPHQTDALIAFAAGVLLGAALLHLLPEALRLRGPLVLFGTAAGALVLYLIEQILRRRGAAAAHVEVHEMIHGHVHDVAGVTAFVGLSIHTLSDGFALGSSLAAGLGMVVFTAIFAHQLPTAFSLSALLKRGGATSFYTLLACAIFALMVPAGAGGYLIASRFALGSWLMPWTLAFSAGNFLHLAFGDLLPDLRRRQSARGLLIAALLVGLAMMAGLRALE